MSKRNIAIAVLAVAYALAGVVATPRLRHSWWYLQENANRRFSSFCWLSAATCAFPWCISSAVEACRNIRSRGIPSKVDPAVFALALGVARGDVEPVNARAMSMARFKARLQGFAERHGGYRLWCFGRFDYCLTPAVKVDFGKVLERFSSDGTFASFAASRLYSPAALFACYVGDAAALDPAVAGFPAQGAVGGAISSLRSEI